MEQLGQKIEQLTDGLTEFRADIYEIKAVPQTQAESIARLVGIVEQLIQQKGG